MGKVMDRVAEEMKCEVIRSGKEKGEDSGEYLTIDAFFMDKSAYNDKKVKLNPWGDPFVLPSAVVELENSDDIKKISYCLWKILCVRAPIRVLICYQKDKDEVTTLKQYLEDVIRRGSLMTGTNGDLLVIIGDESVGEKAPWGEYFTVFEWRNGRLEKTEGLEW